ncbi:phage portal protein [Oerskovia sp. NPDC060338]|uniref:phage portal protein n=1 Tax=Oerskovia sp. NPDC060338 TaxID=3347100 RepID=UPI003650FD9A
MGFFEWLRGSGSATHTNIVPGGPGTSVASPWTPSTLSPNIVIADIFGTTDGPVTRADAMSVPAVAAARHLVTSRLARQPLRTYRNDEEISSQPAWLYRTNTSLPPQMRMSLTLEDLFFNGWALWAVERGANDQITDGVRVPPDVWTFDKDGQVLVHNKPVPANSVILFQGPFEGILTAGARTIRGALTLEAQWLNRIKNPTPTTILKGNDPNDPLSDDEIKHVVDTFAQARNNPNGTIAWIPHNVDIEFNGDSATDLFVQGRNASTLDIARLCGIPATMLDASQINASLTYNTTEGARNEFIDGSIDMWRTPIEARLSMDDVTPRGTRVAFDLTNLVEVPNTGTSPVTED